MSNNKKQLLCSNNLFFDIKKKLTKSCIQSVALYGSEIQTLGTNEERVVNAFETWCWRRMLKIKWTDRIANDEVFQRVKEERLLLGTFTISLFLPKCQFPKGMAVNRCNLTADVFISVVLNLLCFPDAVLMYPFIGNVKMKSFLRMDVK